MCPIPGCMPGQTGCSQSAGSDLAAVRCRGAFPHTTAARGTHRLCRGDQLPLVRGHKRARLQVGRAAHPPPLPPGAEQLQGLVDAAIAARAGPEGGGGARRSEGGTSEEQLAGCAAPWTVPCGGRCTWAGWGSLLEAGAAHRRAQASSRLGAVLWAPPREPAQAHSPASRDDAVAPAAVPAAAHALVAAALPEAKVGGLHAWRSARPLTCDPALCFRCSSRQAALAPVPFPNPSTGPPPHSVHHAMRGPGRPPAVLLQPAPGGRHEGAGGVCQLARCIAAKRAVPAKGSRGGTGTTQIGQEQGQHESCRAGTQLAPTACTWVGAGG